MIRFVNSIVFIVVLLTASEHTEAARPERIVPYTREIALLGDCGANAWVAPVATIDGNSR